MQPPLPRRTPPPKRILTSARALVSKRYLPDDNEEHEMANIKFYFPDEDDPIFKNEFVVISPIQGRKPPATVTFHQPEPDDPIGETHVASADAPKTEEAS